MEPLWSPVVAAGTRWQIGSARKRRKQAKTYGKEGVDGSSPSEGFGLLPAHRLFVLAASAGVCSFDVHAASTGVHRSNAGALSASRSLIACSRPSRARW